ncbi:hypothetical protein TCAL_02505 [Tigriopus californicus]|uniref:BZIP domain-containing protein n=1 Tax=Tigriopus californicus TaxID=6832 RepID=A0A553NSL2_TIGCA|nr:hypothetical protein TCAL_02505 [Tigriopus californicus]
MVVPPTDQSELYQRACWAYHQNRRRQAVALMQASSSMSALAQMKWRFSAPGRVPWNLAGLVGLQQPGGVPGSDPSHGVPGSSGGGGLPHPLPHHYSSHYPSHTAAHYPHLLPPPPSGDPWPSAGPPDGVGHSLATSVASSITGNPVEALSYKMDPEAVAAMHQHQAAAAAAAAHQHQAHQAMYYPHQSSSSPSVSVANESSPSAGGVSTPSGSAPPNPVTSDPLSNFQSIQAIESQDVMQTLHQYFEEETGNWIDSGQGVPPHHHASHPALSEAYAQDYGIGRTGYTDRKKKIIKEWTKSSSIPTSNNGNSSSTSSSATSAAAAAAAAAETAARSAAMAAATGGYENFLYHSYNIKDESALRAAEYPYSHPAAYAAYQEAAAGLVHPYAHHMVSAVAAAGSVGSEPSPAGRPGRRKKRNAAASAGSASSSTHSGGGHSGLTRDERKALTLSLPITVQDIIHLPMDEFNDLLSKHELSEEQLTLCRDIRRRGKNKVAARNCRKRKIDQIKQLEDDVQRIRCKKSELIAEHEKLVAQRSHWTDLVKRLHDYILKEVGHDPSQWQLQMDHSRQVHIMPRNLADETDPSKLPAPYHYAPSVGPPVMEQTVMPN